MLPQLLQISLAALSEHNVVQLVPHALLEELSLEFHVVTRDGLHGLVHDERATRDESNRETSTE